MSGKYAASINRVAMMTTRPAKRAKATFPPSISSYAGRRSCFEHREGQPHSKCSPGFYPAFRLLLGLPMSSAYRSKELPVPIHGLARKPLLLANRSRDGSSVASAGRPCPDSRSLNVIHGGVPERVQSSTPSSQSISGARFPSHSGRGHLHRRRWCPDGTAPAFVDSGS
jgi:hypothetical protein